MTGQGLENDWEAIFDTVFTGDCAGPPFRDPAWRILPIPESPWWGETPILLRVSGPGITDEFAPFWATVAEIAETELCVFGDLLPHPFHLPATADALRSLDDPRYTTWIVGKSAGWGMRVEEGRLSILGGDALFIEAYLRHAGGEAAIRKRFEDHDISMGWEPAWSKDDGDRRWRERTYAMFGWEPFVYPNHGTPFCRIPELPEIEADWFPAFQTLLPTQLEHPLHSGAVSEPLGWRVTALPGHLVRDGGDEFYGAGYLRPKLNSWYGLVSALAEAEDWEVALVPVDAPVHIQSEWVTTLAWVRGFQSVSSLAHRPIAAFGLKRRWVVLSLPEQVSLLMAESDFLDRVAFWAGGEDVFRWCFDDWAVTAGGVSPQILARVRNLIRRTYPWLFKAPEG